MWPRGSSVAGRPENVYCVTLDENGGVDPLATGRRRSEELGKRLGEAKPYDEFLKEWSRLRPPDDALKLYGEWPLPEAHQAPKEAEVQETLEVPGV